MQRCSLFAGLFSVLMLVTTAGCGEGDAPTASIGEEDAPAATGGTATTSRSDAEREREARRQADLHPIVEFTTSAGTFKLKLDRSKAEKTVHNFLEYVASGYYQGTVFHQVEKGFVVAAGGFMENMQPKPARVAIRNEANNGLKNTKMTVAMVRTPGAPHSATSQFLINLADNPFLDYKNRDMSENGEDHYGYCVFGEVVDGAEVVESIAAAAVQSTTVKVKRPEAKKVAVAGQVSTQAETAAQFDEVTFEALPTQPIVIQSARRIK